MCLNNGFQRLCVMHWWQNVTARIDDVDTGPSFCLFYHTSPISSPSPHTSFSYLPFCILSQHACALMRRHLDRFIEVHTCTVLDVFHYVVGGEPWFHALVSIWIHVYVCPKTGCVPVNYFTLFCEDSKQIQASSLHLKYSEACTTCSYRYKIC